MDDYAHLQTEKEIKKLDKRIHAVYSEASKDIQKKLDDFNAKYKVKEQIHLKEVQEGKWTQAEFDNWKKGQVFQSKQWEAKRDQIVNTLCNSNQTAVKMINGQTSNVFGMNATYMNYTLEHNAGVNFGFGIYDEHTVARLIKDDPQLLPKWKINEPKDYIWNKKQVNNAVTQGIIQGESLDQISKRISNGLVMKNENLSKTFARTAMTEAQNAGRMESLKDAGKLGIDVYKEWMATLDSHTRDSHADVDGESVPVESKFSNGLMYPAEAGGDPKEVYNCRCTLVGDLKKFPAKYKRYNNEKGKPIQYMTYKDWEKAKSYGKAGYKASDGGKGKPIDYSKYGDKETFEIMKKYGDFDSFMTDSTLDEYEKVFSSFELMGTSSTSIDTVDAIEAAFKKAGNDFKDKIPKVKTPKVEKKTTSTSISGALPRTASYIDGVTAKGISNYDLQHSIDNYVSKVANRLGISEEEARTAIENGIKRIIQESEFTMRIRGRNLEKVLEDGYFKNQFETGSSGGCFNPDMRKRLEHKMFNVPIDGISDADRPVYGMFCPRWDANNSAIKDYYANGAGSWYGDGITVVLKKENVINNATMTIGDSLDYRGSLVGTEVNRITYAGSFDDGYKLYHIAKINDSTPTHKVHETMINYAGDSDHYFEYQLHGKETHSIKNIDYVVINKSAANRYPSLLQKLDDRGIHYKINDVR